MNKHTTVEEILNQAADARDFQSQKNWDKALEALNAHFLNQALEIINQETPLCGKTIRIRETFKERYTL